MGGDQRLTEEALKILAEQATGHLVWLGLGFCLFAFVSGVVHKFVQAPIWYWQTGVRKGDIIFIGPKKRKAKVSSAGIGACYFYMFDSHLTVPIPSEQLKKLHIEIPREPPGPEVLRLDVDGPPKPLKVELVKPAEQKENE